MSNVPMTLPDLALSVQARPHGHTSSFVELDDGRIFHASFNVGNYSEDGGLTWSEPKQMVDTDGNRIAGGGTSVVKLSGGRSIGMTILNQNFPGDQPLPRPWEIGMAFYRSDDAGRTWQPPTPLSPLNVHGHALQDVFLRTSSGRLVLPMMNGLSRREPHSPPHDVFTPRRTCRLVKNQIVNTGAHDFDTTIGGVYVMYSDDDGRTWHRNEEGMIMILRDWNATFTCCWEPSVTEVAPGRLLMFIRNQLGRLFQLWSDNNGENWTWPQPTVLAASTAPAQIRTLPNGHLLCVWNQESPDEIRKVYARTRLSSAISRDGGRTWEFFQNVESIHETTRVVPGPITEVRPEEAYGYAAGRPAGEWDPAYVEPQGDAHGRWTYPSVLVMQDRVIVAYSSQGRYEEHPTEARLVRTGTGVDGCGQRLKVLPLKWFYGGKQPVDNPVLGSSAGG